MRRLLYFIFGVALLMLQACLDDEISFPEEGPLATDNSIAIVTLLDRIATGELQLGLETSCFDVVYPLTISYNTGSFITIGDDLGLVDVARGQSPGFHVTGVDFPFEVLFERSSFVIENDENLFGLLAECDLGSFRSDFDRYFLSCFDFSYPFTALAGDSAEVSISSAEDYFSFLELQGVNYQPQFKFPIQANAFFVDEVVELSSHYGFYQLFNGCRECPSLFFESERNEDGLNYLFFAEFEGINQIPYSWKIVQNGEELFSKPVQPGEDNVLPYQFDPGEYQVCITAQTDACPGGVIYCETIVAEAVCPDVTYESRPLDLEGYVEIKSNVIEREAAFTWYVDDELIPGATSNPLKYNFLADSINSGYGRYKVCYEVVTPFCPETREYCNFIVLEEPCLGLFFETRQENNNTYIFEAEFPLMNEINYQWLVVDQGQVIASEPEELGGDNRFFFQFEPGVYDVCLFAETPDCPESKFCQRIIVN